MEKPQGVAIFWDLENFGLSGGENENLQRAGRAIIQHVVAERLTPVRELCIAYARKYRNRQKTLYPHKEIEGIINKLGFAVRWSEGIADIELITDIQSLLNTPYLPQTLVLMSSDSDFCSLVSQSIRAGYTVWVVESTLHSKSLGSVASRQLYIDHLINHATTSERRSG